MIAQRRGRPDRWWGPLSVLLALTGGRAGAVTEQRAGATLTVGATDNARLLPEGAPGKRADGFARARAGAGIDIKQARGEHEASVGADVSTFMRGSQGTFVQGFGGFGSRFSPTQFTRLDLSAGLSYARVGFFTDPVNVNQPASLARPGGAFSYLALSLREGFTWEPDPRWKLTQNLVASGLEPISDDGTRPVSWAVDHEAGLFRVYRNDEVGGILRLGYGQNLAIRRMGVEVLAERSLTYADGTAVWRRRLSEAWQGEAAAGWFLAWPEGADSVGGPAGRLSLQWADEDIGLVELRAERRVYANVFLAEPLLTQGVSVRAQRAFGRWRYLVASVTGGYQQGESLAANSTFGNVGVLYVRGGLAYDDQGPLRFSIEYEFTDQSRDGMGDTILAASFRRSVIAASVEWRWPAPDRAQGAGLN